MEDTGPGVLDIGRIDLPPLESEAPPPALADGPRVEMTVTPRAAASRRRADWRGLAGEVVQFAGAAPFEYRFQGQVHVLMKAAEAVAGLLATIAELLESLFGERQLTDCSRKVVHRS